MKLTFEICVSCAKSTNKLG